ncbi:hypothetical protein B0H19DRAFT_1083751 [Mycena capillaripes]|nr:hypothetical protein B0H19DRAFT_1083751 [Mycena capillaripes]
MMGTERKVAVSSLPDISGIRKEPLFAPVFGPVSAPERLWMGRMPIDQMPASRSEAFGKVAQRYTVNFASAPTEVVIGVLATQTAAGAAGLVLAMELNMVPSGRANCTAGAFLLMDAGWKSTKGAIPAGFEQPGFDDSSWPAVMK